MEIVLTLYFRNDFRVEVNFHYLHPDAKALSAHIAGGPAPILMRRRRPTLRRPWWMPVHAVLRPLLETLDLVRAAQRDYEAVRARRLVSLGSLGGGGGEGLPAWLSPCVLHDACTLYIGCAAGGCCWFRLDPPCERCGGELWGLSCTPPRFSRGRRSLVRDPPSDALCAFCLRCLARRDKLDLAELALAWGGNEHE